VSTAREVGLPYVLLGKGANILVGDLGVRGLVIRSEAGGIEFLDDVRVRAGAGRRDVRRPDRRHRVPRARRPAPLRRHPLDRRRAIWQNLHFLSPGPERERTCFIEEVVEAPTC
jgi:UDP-N-acetylmuramate dehydrogenase